MAQSYVMNMDDVDLTRVQDGIQEQEEQQSRFVRKRLDQSMETKHGSSFNRCTSSAMGTIRHKTNKSVTYTGKRLGLPKQQTTTRPYEDEKVEDQEKRLMGKLDTLMDRMVDFEERCQPYKLNRLEITKKALAFNLEKKRRIRDRNSVVLKSNN